MSLAELAQLPDAVAANGAVDTWSDWLQRRLVDDTDSRDVLTLLEAHGRTRRVRGRARHRLTATP
ncbi:hypothetical protein AB6N24_01640 [Cellulomonas sp. 179-A 4D5 NHS]|uniref:hypothetical protein n=1 Tax=Cellulomonas sp. 179-A 4D5 NHS TaxID=3142378 RepID=UPI0039A2802A